MSYILDALRKADAERERGTVPGIHAQAMSPGALPGNARGSARLWAWLAGAVIVVLAGLLLWSLLGRGGPATPGAAARDVVAAAPPPLPPAAAMPAAPPVAPPAQTPPTPMPPVIAPAPISRAPAPAPAPHGKPAPPVPAVAKPAPAAAPGVVPAAARAPVVAGASAPAAADNQRIVTPNELPDEIRRQLPALTVGGSMYSSTPADRIVIVNGQVLHEGDAIAPGVVLQQIKLKAAVLGFKGYRVEITY